MEGDDVGDAAGQDVAVGDPAGAAFAVLAGRETAVLQHAVEALDTPAGVPDKGDREREAVEEAAGGVKLLRAGAAEAHHDLAQVTDVGQFGPDALHRRGFELRVERG